MEIICSGLKAQPDIDEWHALTAKAKGADIKVEVYTKKEEHWTRFQPFDIHVSTDSIDPYISYRLISPSYVTYEELTKMLNNLKDQRDQGSKPFTKDETKEWKRFMRQVHPDLHQNSVDASSSTISAVQDFIKRMGGLNQNQNRRRPGPGPAGFGGNQAAAVDRYLNYALKAYTGLAVGSLLSKAGAMAYAYKNRPKSFIAKRIAALRSLYQKMLYDAQYNPSKAGIIKQAAAKVLGIIDKLMAVLQKAADGRLKGYATPMVM